MSMNPMQSWATLALLVLFLVALALILEGPSHRIVQRIRSRFAGNAARPAAPAAETAPERPHLRLVPQHGPRRHELYDYEIHGL